MAKFEPSSKSAWVMPRLYLYFLISSVLLLGSTVWMVYADYDREWKTHQREFRDLSIEKTDAEKAEALSEGERAEHDQAQFTALDTG